jgi:outer membrane receptor for ferrienterochelin and colicins
MSKRRNPLQLSLMAAAIAAAIPVQAQETQASPQSIAQAEPASNVVISNDDIMKYGDTSLVEVLKRVPGVSARGADVRVGGPGNGETRILVNGQRMPAGFVLDTLSPGLIERIEVQRAASAEMSAHSIAGTINIMLKQGARQGEFKIGAGMGEGLFAPAASLQWADRAGPLSYGLLFSVLKSHSETESSYVEQRHNAAGTATSSSNGASVIESDLRAVQLAPRLNLTLPSGDSLTWQSYLSTSRLDASINTHVEYTLGPAVIFPDLVSSTENRADTMRSDLTWVRKFSGGAKLDAKFGGAWNSNLNDSEQLGFTPTGINSLKRLVTTDSEERSHTYIGKYTLPVADRHLLALGWDVSRTAREESRDALFGGTPAIPPYPGFPGRPAIPATPIPQDFEARVRRLALFAHDEWSVTPHWSMTLGARWEKIATHSEGTPAIVTFDSRTDVWSPVFQTLYKLPGDSADQFKFALSRTYKAPAASRLMPRRVATAINSQFEPDLMGNTQLLPELSSGFDASYDHHWAKGALLSVSASMRRIDNYTRNMLTQGPDTRWVSRPVNAGRARTRGLEFDLKFPLKAVMDQAPALDLRANLSRNWSSVESVPGPDNYVDQLSPLSATLGVDYKGAVLSGGASFVYRKVGPVRISNEERTDGNGRRDLDLYVLWKFTPQSLLRVSATSLLEVDAVAQNYYADPVRGSAQRSTTNPSVIYVRAALESKF